MSIKRINEFPDGSGSLSNDDVFLFMDDPSNGGTTKKISLSQISAAIGGGGLSDSDRYVICKAGDDIAVKYSEAKALTPGGSSKSATNRAYLIVMPGVYPLSAQWEIDAEFVDVIGLGSSSLERGCNVAVTVTGYSINASADNVRIKGIGTTSDRAFNIDGNKPLQVFEECSGGDNSFGGDYGTASGSFTNCVGGDNSFGGGIGGTASGTFANCTAGDGSFGGGLYTLFGGAWGTFTNCTAGAGSFGGGTNAVLIGKFYYCRLTAGQFPAVGVASGSFSPGVRRLCIDGDNTINNDTGVPMPPPEE